MQSTRKTLALKRSHNDSVGEGSCYSSSKSRLKTPSDKFSSSDYPCIELASNARLLPKLSAVLERSTEECVGMEDLDQLQQDFEKLLSTCVVRFRLLNREMAEIDKNRRDKNRLDRVALKGRRRQETPKLRKTMNGVRIPKRKPCTYPVNNSVIVTRNVCDETSDRFWLFVEQYAGEASRDDVAYLQELLAECSEEVDIKIPELGEYYMNKWINDTEFQSGLANGKTKDDIQESVMTSVADIFSDPLVQRMVDNLIEEKIVPNLPDMSASQVKLTQKNFVKTNKSLCSNLCMGLEHSSEDEILQEIKRCHQDLEIVNYHNYRVLYKLEKIVRKDQKRVDMKVTLSKWDKRVHNVYMKFMGLKQKEQEEEMCFGHVQNLDEPRSVMNEQLTLNKNFGLFSDETLSYSPLLLNFSSSSSSSSSGDF